MPIEFFCSQCRNRLRVEDSVAGRQAQCPVCGAIVVVPPAGVAGQPPYATGAVGAGTSTLGEGASPIPPIPPEATALPPGYGPQPVWYNTHSAPQYSATPGSASAQTREEGWGVASLVLGLFGLLAWCCPLIGIVVGILAVIFGIIALGKGGTGLGIIGIILGALCLVLSIISMIVGMAMMLAEPALTRCLVSAKWLA